VEPYTEKKIHFDGTHLWQDTIDIQELKSILVGMVEKLAFQLRSEEWLTSTVVIKKYAILILIPKQSNAESHTLRLIIL
jgi:hypothetical protein